MVELLNEWGQRWFEPFGSMVIQNTLFLALLLAALYWLRNTSARVRHGVALVGLVKLVTPPFLPMRANLAQEYIELPTLTTVSLAPTSLPTTAATTEPVSLTLAGLLFGIWCVVTIAILTRALFGTIGFGFTLRHADAADDNDSREWSRRTRIPVRITERVPVPMTVGLLPRTIYVPPQWTQWTSPARRAVLLHEMAHIHRRDGVLRTFETLVRALYWFHPLVPLLMRRLDAYREQSCDEAAANPDPSGRVAYSRLLVEIAEHLLHNPRVDESASTLMRRHNELLDRVHYLTDKESVMRLSKSRATILAVAMAMAVVSLSWYQSTAVAPAAPQKDHSSVVLSVAGDGEVAIDGKKAKLVELGALLKEQIDDPKAVVSIDCSPDAPMGALYKVHAALRSAGMYKVRYMGMGDEGIPLMLPNEKLIQKAKSMPAEDIALLKVSKGGKCVLNGKKLKASAIHKVVAKHLAKNEHLVVSLKMAGDATYSEYLAALKELRAAKANRIFINEPGT